MSEQVQRSFSGSRFEKIAGYCRAVRAGNWVSVSGTAASPGEGGELGAMDTYAQTMNAFTTAISAAEGLGAPVSNVVRSRVFLGPEASWEDASRAHHDVFEAFPPANTTLYVHRLIPPGALVEIEIDVLIETGNNV